MEVKLSDVRKFINNCVTAHLLDEGRSYEYDSSLKKINKSIKSLKRLMLENITHNNFNSVIGKYVKYDGVGVK
jgi:hypothetical protein